MICTLPDGTPPFTEVGKFPGDTAAAFTLYGIDGSVFDLGTALLQKPVLMIAGSYTCPKYRNSLPVINEVQSLFGDQLTTVVVYTAEAHPIIDDSPYSGNVNPHAANIAAGILYEQPSTYGERIEVVQDMLDSMDHAVPVVIDGACNEWWQYYGPAPNIAYLIGMDGVIVARHTWFDQYPQDIVCDIEALLGLPSTDCIETLGGQFTMQWLTNDTIYGDPTSTITISTRIDNTGALPVLVEVHRLENNLPAGWSSALCLDVCHTPDISYAEVLVPAGSSQDFHFYFYPENIPGYGHARIGVRNAEDNSNSYMLELHGFGMPLNSIPEFSLPAPLLWPVPAVDLIHVPSDLDWDRAVIIDGSGRTIMTRSRGTITVSDLNPGVYWLQLFMAEQPISQRVRFVKI